jgi:hypothetical protein
VELNIVNEVATLERLTIGQLRQRFAELFGEATQASNRTWLVHRDLPGRRALASDFQRGGAGIFAHPHGAFLEARTAWYSRQDCLLVR